MISRVKSYANAAMLNPTLLIAESFFPTEEFCGFIYGLCGGQFELKRKFLSMIRSIASRSDNTFCTICQRTMILLAGFKMLNYMLIHKWILVKNAGLLSWQGLAKEIEHIIAAYRKYMSLGDSAPYAKLLYKPEELPEFHRDRLLIPFTIAHAIAAKYGQLSFANTAGSDTSAETQALVQDALVIVKVMDYARTVSNQHYHGYIFGQNRNEELDRGMYGARVLGLEKESEKEIPEIA